MKSSENQPEEPAQSKEVNESSYAELLPNQEDLNFASPSIKTQAQKAQATLIPADDRPVEMTSQDKNNSRNELIFPKSSTLDRSQIKKDIKYTQVSPSTLLESNQPYPAESKFDIFEGQLKDLPPLERVKAEYILGNNKVTPFDSSKYIQTLFNPLAGLSPNCQQNEIITVQLYTQHVIPLPPDEDADVTEITEEFELDNQKDSSDTKMKCLQKHDLELCDEALLQLKKVATAVVSNNQPEPEAWHLQSSLKRLNTINPLLEQIPEVLIIKDQASKQPKPVAVDKSPKEFKCEYCSSVFEQLGEEGEAKKQFYSCRDEKCQFFVCETCNLKAITRQKLLKQTSNHSYYQNYVLVPSEESSQKQFKPLVPRHALTSAIEAQEELRPRDRIASIIVPNKDVALQKNASFSENKQMLALEKIEKDTRQANDRSVQSMKFADVVPDNKQDDPCHHGEKFVEIGLWRFQNGSYQCYRIFKVQRPVIFNYRKTEQEKLSYFLFKGENNQLFYLQKTNERVDRNKVKDQPNQFILKTIDLEKVVTNDEKQLNASSRGYFQIPTSNETQFVEKHNRLLNALRKVDQTTALPWIQTIEQREYFVLVAPFVWSASNQRQKWVATKYRNIHFLDLKNDKNDYTIFDADLFLGIKTEEKHSTELIVFLREATIIEIFWRTPCPDDALKRENLKQQDAPLQATKRNYYCTVPETKPQYFDQVQKLQHALKSAKRSLSLVEGYLHNENKKVSLIFGDGGLFLFDLVTKQEFAVEGGYYGRIGNCSDVKISNFKIQNDERISGSAVIEQETYDITGKMQIQAASWSGFVENESSAKQVELDQDEGDGQVEDNQVQQEVRHFKYEELKLDLQTEIIKGFGKDEQSKEFEVQGTIEVSATTNRKTVRWEQKSNLAPTLYFEGTVSKDMNQIYGKCGTQKDKLQNVFNLFMDESFGVSLEFLYQNKWINLIGTFDRKLCEIKGNFRASKNLEGQIYQDGANQSQNTFKLVGLEHQNRAVQVKVGENVSDAQFCTVKSGKNQDNRIFAVCGLEKQDNYSNQPGYDIYQLDLLDLDTKTDPKVVGEGLKLAQFQFLVPDNFREFKNDLGQQQLPFYNFLSFSIECERDSKTTEDVYKFKGQMTYQDIFCSIRKLIFIQGQSLSNQKNLAKVKEEKLQYPQWQSTISEQFHINYPILAYKSNKPTDNEIIICNLALNKRQKVISLGKFKFLQFLETGLNPEKCFNRGESGLINTSIFFLVELNSIMRVMYYKCFPWPLNSQHIDRTSLELFQFQEEIRIITGCLDPKIYSKYIDPCRMTQEKLKIGTLLVRNVIEDIQMMLVLQLNDEIVVFNMNKPDFVHPPVILPGSQMNAERMQRGPNESIYFTEISESGNFQIVALTFEERVEVTRQVIYKLSQNKICQFSLDYAWKQDDEYSHCFYMIDNEQHFYKLEFTDSERTELKVTFKKNLGSHSGIRRMLNKAEQTCWEGSILHEQGINALLINQGKSETKINAVSYRIYGNMQKEHDFLEIKDDKTYERKRLGKPPKRYEKKVLSIWNVPWIGKHAYEVEEAGLSYFLMHNEFFSRKIKIMRYDTDRALNEDLVLIGNSAIGIRLTHTNQYLLFNQNDLSYMGTQNFSRLDPVSSVTANLQYFKFERNQMHVKLSSGIVAFNKDGQPQIVAEDQHFETMQSQLTQATPPDYEILHLQHRTASSQNVNYEGQYAQRKPPSNMITSLVAFSQREDNRSKRNLENLGGMVGLLHFIKSTSKAQEQDFQYKLQGQKIDAKVFMTKLKDFQTKTPDFKKVYSFAVYFPTLPKSFEIEEKMDLNRLKITKDYVVINLEKHVLFAKITDISRANRLFRTRFKSSKDPKYRRNLLKEFIEERDECEVQFSVLNFGRLGDSIISKGMKIIVASEHNVQIAEKGEVRQNVIQISFANAAMLWCLDENKEVTFVEKQTQFDSHKNFVHTGMLPHLNKSKSQRQMHLSRFISMNEFGTLMVVPQTEISNQYIFRGFSFMSLLDVLYIQKCQQNSIAINELNNDTVLQCFNGLTFFEIFRNEIDYHEMIYSQVQTLELKAQKVVDMSGQVSDNIWIRKLFWTLNLPMVGKSKHVQTQKHHMLKSNVMQDLLHDDECSHIIDPLLKLLMLSSEFRLSNLISDFDSFTKVFQLSSSEINTFLEESFFQNGQCSEISNMKWDSKNEILAFGSNTSMLSQDHIIAKFDIAKKQKKGSLRQLFNYFSSSHDKKEKIVPVEVKIVEIEWLSGSVGKLYEYLGQLDDNQIFGNELIKVLLGQSNYTNQIVFRIVVPFLCYMVISLYYFSKYVPDVKVENFMGIPGDQQGAGLRIVIIVFASFFLIVELRQMWGLKLQYFMDFWNMIYICANVLPIFIVVEHGGNNLQLKHETLVQLASFQTVILWLMVFYWCRITPELAFYVKMINETIVDIGYFMIMLLLCIMMFANGIFVLNRGATNNFEQDLVEDPSPLFTSSFNNEYFDAIMSQWQLGLGNFYTDPFSSDSGYILCWIYFILATFFTQITFMNMLIALMGVTFERVSDAKERNALMETTQMYADFLWAISLSTELEGKRYLYIVKPIENDQEASNEDNSIASVRRQLKLIEKRTSESIHDSTGRISIEVEDLNKKVQTYFRNNQQVVKSLTKMQSEMDSKLDAILKALKQK